MRHIYQREVVDEAAATALANAMAFYIETLLWEGVDVRAEGKTVIVSSLEPVRDPEALGFVEIGSVEDDAASTHPVEEPAPEEPRVVPVVEEPTDDSTGL